MDILKHSMNLAGVPQDVQDTILNNEALKGITIPDEVTTKVKNQLTTLERAKAHPDIANHFKGTHFGIVDTATKEALKTGGFSDEEIASIFDGKKTAERLKVAIEQASKKGYAKAGKSGDAQLEELRNELKKHQSDYTAKEAQFQTIISEQNARFEQVQYDQALRGAIADSGLKLMDLPTDVLQVSTSHLIGSKLTEIGAVAKTVNGRIKLYRADNLEQEHYTGAEATDFYKLLPTVMDSLIEKRNDPKGGNGAPIVPASVKAKSRADQARLTTLNSILQKK